MTEKEIEAMEDKIHNMSNAQLVAMEKDIVFIPVDIAVSELPEEEPEPEWVDLLHSMSATQLRAFHKDGTFINMTDKQQKMLDKELRKHKSAKTGLSKKVIKKIETNKQKATLEEIIAYCKGLQISFKDFLPELFSASN